MKLYIKEKVLSFRDKFSVLDEGGQERYFAKGEIFTFGKKLHVYDSDGSEVAFIRQKLLTILPKYTVEIGENAFEIVKEFTLLNQSFYIKNTNCVIKGDFWAHEYEIFDTAIGQTIARVSKKWLTWGDSYEIEVFDDRNEFFALCVVIAVDCINENSDTAIAASS
ncbi:MAG: LURP-one-related family protein [Ruminococcus sp.]|jgi:uncharacterized protein YxjI|nr:LURP-one-related family protein [Ruminococcus sp.]